MQITNNVNIASNKSQKIDNSAQIKAIDKRIEEVKAKIQDVGADEKMDDKLKKETIKQLNQTITDLTNQKIQIESASKQEISNKQPAKDSLINEDRKYDRTELTSAVMFSLAGSKEAMSSMSSIKKDLEGTAKVLTNEIRLDAGRGIASEKKMDKLANIQENIVSLNDKMASLNGEQNQKSTIIVAKGNEANKQAEIDEKAEKEDAEKAEE